jgi:hypothetical protein
MNIKPMYKSLYFDKGFTPYPVDRERYEIYKTLPDDHRNMMGVVGQMFQAKCHNMTQAGAFELVMAMSEFLDKERE